ncbi:hypothetical protein [Devosia sediminis]|uniref:Uncharacterized protein n=1 Tax=Devosia sediminis TaxID=2798801 RepID=A0A934IXB9_9HYPH|nr:hypothetical protein [Devosia sediminis]MBJ3784017.1 hypothetical protein [Devosia sediminis]
MGQNVILGWIARRVPEVLGLVTMLVTFYNALPPAHQETIVAVVTGQGGGLTVSAVIGLGLYVWAQIMSYRATVKPQVVTTDAKKIELPKAGEGVGTTRKVEALAEGAPQPKSLWERLTGR